MAKEAFRRNEYIQSQIDARQRPAVVKTRLLTMRSKYPRGLLLAVEGNADKVVFSCWLSQIRPTLAYEFFVCGGKRTIRQLRNLLVDDKGNASDDLLFFVDRDFDDLTGFATNDGVFMLQQYSVENYLVSSAVLDKSIKVAFPGSGEPRSRYTICELFESDYVTFLGHSAAINESIYMARMNRIDIDDQIPPGIAGIATVEINNVTPTSVSSADLIKLPDDLPFDEVGRLKAQFAKLNPPQRYRGKFALKFMRIWLDKLCAEYKNPKLGLFPPAESSDAKIQHEELSLGSLASRSEVPVGLSEFLKEFGF